MQLGGEALKWQRNPAAIREKAKQVFQQKVATVEKRMRAEKETAINKRKKEEENEK